MGAGDMLRQLDQRFLPRLSRALIRLSEGQTRWGALVWAAVLSVAAVLGTAVWTADQETMGGRTAGDVTRVGVSEGDSIPSYLRSASKELEVLAASPPASGETFALVSLATYLAPQRVSPILGDLAVLEVFARVPLPGRQTQIVRIVTRRVPADIMAGMRLVAEGKERQAAEYRGRRNALLEDSDAEGELRQFYDSGAEVAAAEATAYRSYCSCLYAAVVRAAPAVLRALAARPGVRGVDPAPEVRSLDEAVFSPPLPEQADTVPPPADANLPPAVPGFEVEVPALTGSPVPESPIPTATAAPATGPEPTPSQRVSDIPPLEAPASDHSPESMDSVAGVGASSSAAGL